jgi:NAD(P)H-dependent flavin oxidoreductase YrpB (nitropropane dioxygenase family)
VALTTRVTQILGIRYPIIQGGLAHIATGAFAAAVSNAGALGQITATSLENPADLRREVAMARERTSRPFGINLAIGHRPLDPFLDVALELRPAAISLTGGNPAPFIPRIKAAGITVMVLVGSARQALKAEELGADIVIAVGYEGGGHLGRDDVGSLVLTRRVVESVRVPVVASGGFADGYGLLAALALGAEGVEMGTRFLATEECPIHPRYKEALLQAAENQTTLIGRSIGAPGRVLPGRLVEEIQRREQAGATLDELLPLIAGHRNRLGALSGDLDGGYVWAGQGVGLIRDVPTVAALVERLVSEARSRYEDLQRAWQ